MSVALTTRIKVKDNEGRVVDEKEVATYAGLLAKAHEEGLCEITTKLLQVPAPDNGEVAIVEATVVTGKGRFSGIGDACPGNVGRRIVPHLIRMAETRAKARSLRDAVNIGVVALEELGGDEVETGAPTTAANTAPRSRPPLQEAPRADDRRAPEVPDARRTQPPRGGGSTRSDRMTENQRRWLYRYLMVDQRHPEKNVPGILCRAAQVDELDQITKSMASTLIDAWKGEAANA